MILRRNRAFSHVHIDKFRLAEGDVIRYLWMVSTVERARELPLDGITCSALHSVYCRLPAIASQGSPSRKQQLWAGKKARAFRQLSALPQSQPMFCLGQRRKILINAAPFFRPLAGVILSNGFYDDNSNER